MRNAFHLGSIYSLLFCGGGLATASFSDHPLWALGLLLAVAVRAVVDIVADEGVQTLRAARRAAGEGAWFSVADVASHTFSADAFDVSRQLVAMTRARIVERDVNAQGFDLYRFPIRDVMALESEAGGPR